MKKILTAAIVLLGIVAFSLPVQALQLDFNTVFSGGTPAGSTPWATATFTGSGSVTLTINSSMTTESQFIREMYFNLDPTLDPTKLSFVAAGISGTAYPTISRGVNAFQADGDGKFDILLAFSTSGGPGNVRFDGTNSVAFTITSTEAGLTAESFNFASLTGGGEGIWKGATHIQGIPIPGSTAEDSSWVGPGEGSILVPEPVTMILLGLGLLGVGIAVRKRS